MFKMLLNKMESVNFKAAVSKGTLACPKCGAKPSKIPGDISELLTCNSCGTRASANEWAAGGTSGVLVGAPERRPANTKITREDDAMGATIWDIPASGKSGGLLIFAVLWCAITGLVSGGFLFAFLSGDSPKGNFPDWALIPFFSIFWAVGLGMFYAGFRNKFAKHRLSVEGGMLILRREFFGKTRDRSLPLAGIKTISQVVFYQQNYQPVYGIEIRGDSGKLRFGSVLSAEEKAWLVADMRRVVFGESVADLTSASSNPVRESFFSITLPNSRKQFLPVALMLFVIGVVFIVVGLRLIDPPRSSSGSDTSAAFDFFEMIFGLMTFGFRGMWLLMSSIVALAGASMIVWLVKSRGQEMRIEGSDSEISLRTYSRGLVLKDRSFPRASVSDIRASLSGSSNGKSMKRLELIVGDKAEKMVNWIDGTIADEIVVQVRRALGA
jgi:hypothetical protein